MRTHLGSALALATLTGLMLAPAVASADNFHATRSEKLVEKSHKIDIQIGHGYAELRVRRTVHNGGPRHDQATFYIDMPTGAVAVGLRTLGMVDGKPHWFAGELLEAEAAAARYKELTGVGGYYPKDPALLSWRSQSRLALQVFPCAPDADKTVEYTLRIPTEYRDGRYHILLPRMGTDTVVAEASVTPLVNGENIYIGDKVVNTPSWLQLKDEVDLAVAPNTTNALDGALASLSVNAQKNIVHYHIDAAPRLGAVPQNAHVVVLVDASRSFSDVDTANELAMARAFVGHFANGKIAIVPFNRKVHAPSGFLSVTKARSAFQTMTIERQNGSNVDAALAQADSMLAKAPAGSARRILLLTDALTRAEVTPELLKSKLTKSGALLHVGIVNSQYESHIEADDDHAWNAVTRPSGGLVWNASIERDESKEKTNEVIFEEWARPKRIRHFAVQAQGLQNATLNMPHTLDEGQGVEELDLPKNAVSALEVSGELWATPVKKVLARDEAEEQRWAGMFFGTASYSAITEAEMMPLAMLGKVVSPVTSYLAIEPGVRPSTEGLEEIGSFGMGFGSGSGHSSCRLYGASSVKYADDKETFLRKEMERAMAKCGGGTHKANATFETTQDEIVAVKSSVEGEPANSPLATCFDEAMWDVYLRSDFRADHEVFNVKM